MERCNYFLHACVETAQRKEAVDGRLVQFLLSNPTNDGGQWDMLVNLIGQLSSSSLAVIGCRDALMALVVERAVDQHRHEQQVAAILKVFQTFENQNKNDILASLLLSLH